MKIIILKTWLLFAMVTIVENSSKEWFARSNCWKGIHSWKLTFWTQKMKVWKIIFLFKQVICRFHVDVSRVYCKTLFEAVLIWCHLFLDWEIREYQGYSIT